MRGISMSRLSMLLLGGALLFVMTGCGSSLAAPFNGMQQAPITVFRLQNFSPPQQTASAAAPGGIALPPQIQSWITAGASLLPPGLLPPGLIPGAAPAAPLASNVPMFHNFPILATSNITDSKIHDEVLSILGTSSNWGVPKESCMYAEFGFSIGQINQPPADILVSVSCNQVQSFGFAWPYGANVALQGDTEKRIVAVIQKQFGG
ncbi:MAG: hypothetical protein ABI183_20535 [Polyangiaceae bacterium]